MWEYTRGDPTGYEALQRPLFFETVPGETRKGIDQSLMHRAHKPSHQVLLRSRHQHIDLLRCLLTLERNRHICASLGFHLHRQEYFEKLWFEFPCGTACSASHASTTQYLASFLCRKAGRRTYKETDPGMRKISCNDRHGTDLRQVETVA